MARGNGRRRRTLTGVVYTVILHEPCHPEERSDEGSALGHCAVPNQSCHPEERSARPERSRGDEGSALSRCTLPFPWAQWHEHVGSIDEESLLLDHAHLGGEADGGGPRLAVMHAWVWLPNPAGTFATDNWALPFARLGLPAPPNASRAARAVALMTCMPYFARLFEAVGKLDDRESDAVLEALEHSRGYVQEWLDARKPNEPVSSADLARLEKIWSDLAAAVTGSVRPASANRLALSIRDW